MQPCLLATSTAITRLHARVSERNRVPEATDPFVCPDQHHRRIAADRLHVSDDLGCNIGVPGARAPAPQRILHRGGRVSAPVP